MSNFVVGDIVVYIKHAIDPRPNRKAPKGGTTPPAGKPLRVAEVHYCCGEQGIVIDGYYSNHPTRSWVSWRFRRVEKATDEFTRQMRALKPQKGKAHA